MWLQPRRREPQKRLTGLKCVACTNTSWTFDGGASTMTRIQYWFSIWLSYLHSYFERYFIVKQKVPGIYNKPKLKLLFEVPNLEMFENLFLAKATKAPSYIFQINFRIISAIFQTSWRFVQYQSTVDYSGL